jgi:acetoin utilization protein AcuC
MQAIFVTHNIFRAAAFGAHHPLSTARQPAVVDICDALGWLDPMQVAIAPQASARELERFHAQDYVAAMVDASARGMATQEQRLRYHLGSMECPVFAGVFDRARTTVGGAMLAADLALDGAVVFFPAGGTHHGRRDRASGFCYFNDPVFAILNFLDAGLTRVAYVDLDAHHGDGVEAAFQYDPRVVMASLHEEERWPGTGRIEDTCGGRALNVPLPRGITDAEYGAVVERILLPFLAAQQAQALVLVLGADGLKGDPLSSMQLMNSTLWRVARQCLEICPRAVVLGGGGYNPWTTARLWAGFWGQLAGYPLPLRLPGDVQRILSALTCDLVDDEDHDPAWLARLDDPSIVGPIRDEVERLIAELLPRVR